MKKYLMIFISAIVSGFLICIGATVYLSMLAGGHGDYLAKICGALFFTLGLFAIIHFNTWLYTGKVGYLLDKDYKYFLDLLVCVFGNIMGAIGLAALIGTTRIGTTLNEQALTLVEQKQADSWYSILILAIMCGVMIYISVKGHQVVEYPIGKVVICFLAIAIFILCGFEHVVANAAYYTYAKVANWKAVGYFALMALGNGIGAVAFDGLLKLVHILSENQKQ